MAHLRIALILCKRLIRSRTFLCRFFCFVFVLLLIYMYTYDPCTNLGKRKIQVDRMCPKNSDKCYNVQLGKMTLRKKERFVRFMIYDDRAFGDETGVALRPPEGGKESSERFRCSDIQKWPADHTTFTSSHVASMIASTFLLGSLSLGEMGVGKQVLEIGLGGGSFDMGLHKMKPHVNITVVEIEPVVAKLAYKWFGVVNSETHHTILQDGKEFLEQAYNQGRKFDVVAIDACGSYFAPMICPCEPFQDPIILEKIQKMLTGTGSLLVNIASANLTEIGNYKWKKFLQTVKSLFPVCLHITLRDIFNVVVACTKSSMAHIPDLTLYLDDRFETIMSTLNLKYILDSAYITSLHAK
ncbi:hypothetical protein V3C99_014227 [Haemonchus contortus]